MGFFGGNFPDSEVAEPNPNIKKITRPNPGRPITTIDSFLQE